MNALRLLLGLCLLLPFIAHGQPAGATPPEPVRVRFLFLDESNGAYAVKIGPVLHDLGARPYMISAPVEFPPGARMELQKVLPDPLTGTPVHTRVLTHDAPSDFTHALAVIAPTTETTADGSKKYRVRFYDIAPEKTPARSIRVLNLSPMSMAARFGNTRVEIASGAQEVVAPTFDNRNRVRSLIASDANGNWQMIFNSFLSLPENTRMTGIVIYSASGMLHTYTDDEIETLGPPKPGCFWLTFSDTP